MTDFNFQKWLRESILEADEKLDRNELLVDIFKIAVAQLLEYTMKKGVNRLEGEALKTTKRNLINEFRNTSLEQYQKSVKWYENLFDTAMQEILNDAALAHGGMDQVMVDENSQLEINPEAYINEGGLFIPPHLKK